MSGATHLVPFLRRTPPPLPPPHLLFPRFLYDIPQESTFFQKDPFFLPQMQIQTSLLRSEPVGTIFSTPQFQCDSFSIEDPRELAESSDLLKKASKREIKAELLNQNSLFESPVLGEFDEPKVGSKPNKQCSSAYNKLMKSFSRIGNVDEVLRLFSEMRDSSCDRNVLCYNTVINALVISGRAKDAQDMFDEMLLSGVVPNDSTFNILVKLLCEFSKKQSFWIGAKMKEFEFVFDSTSYSTFVTGLCKVGRLEEARDVLDSMKCTPTLWTYTPIIEGYCLQGKIESAKELITKMERIGCKPNTVTYNILIKALCKAGRFDEVERVIEESQTKRWVPNSITYNTYMNGLCKMSMYKQAIEKVEIMINKGLKPSHVTIGILINCLCRDSKFSEAQNLLHKSRFLNRGNGVICYNTLMSRLSEINRWRSVLKLLTDMFKKGINPNTRTFNIVIHSLCQDGKSNLAKALFTTGGGFVRNTVTYNTLLYWFYRESRFNEAWVLLSSMGMDKIAPDEKTFGIVVEGLCREGNFAKATGCFLESLPTGVAGDRTLLLVNRLIKNRRMKEMLQLLDGMQKRGVTLDASMFDSTIRIFCRYGFCASVDMYMQRFVLEKMLETIHKFDQSKQDFR